MAESWPVWAEYEPEPGAVFNTRTGELLTADEWRSYSAGLPRPGAIVRWRGQGWGGVWHEHRGPVVQLDPPCLQVQFESGICLWINRSQLEG